MVAGTGKERGFVAHPHEVRGIQEGCQTQIRRVVNPQPKTTAGEVHFPWALFCDNGVVHTWNREGVGGQNWNANQFPDENKYAAALERTEYTNPCPYGRVGDRLWLKERAVFWCGGAGGTSQVIYSDSMEIDKVLKDMGGIARQKKLHPEDYVDVGNWEWWSARRMPRWASRILLEITDVRLERVQDITEEDAIAEGVRFDGEAWLGAYCTERKEHAPFESARAAFWSIWDAIYAKRGYGFTVNPWLWVLTFKVLSINGMAE